MKPPVLGTLPVQEEEPDVTDTKPTMVEAQNKYVSEKLACSSQYRGQESDLPIVKGTSDNTVTPWIPAGAGMTDSNILLLMKGTCVFFVHMTVKNRLKSYDTNVPGYPDSNTITISVSRPGEEDVENKRLNQEIKELKQSLETAEEAREETMENLYELLKLKMETAEEAKQETESKLT